MAVTHSDTIRNGLANLVVDAIDTAGGAGKILFTTGSASNTGVIATLTFAATAFGDAGAGTNPVGRCTANAIDPDTSAQPGTVAFFHVQTFGSADIFSGSVSQVGGGGDITLSSVAIGDGDTISITSLNYTSSA